MKAHRLCVSLNSGLESNKEEAEGSGCRVYGGAHLVQLHDELRLIPATDPHLLLKLTEVPLFFETFHSRLLSR